MKMLFAKKNIIEVLNHDHKSIWRHMWCHFAILANFTTQSRFKHLKFVFDSWWWLNLFNVIRNIFKNDLSYTISYFWHMLSLREVILLSLLICPLKEIWRRSIMFAWELNIFEPSLFTECQALILFENY